ncbi:YbjN domain-containing protein [Cellulomonas wangsupingiae]|uniref:YbjN domain-containing protein n=1 Tax=Cellulomonas wangsupingiae TaxID=2968085 RepID=A0ABY5K448_9CELL|nr:YbjN domain-containing protein [Cellulomonas wangsupingiae]MCC2336207.1 YbjN domain-containing protein [Cellulomonas wangsupingiae]UUI64548.1 YbjN domain-containing protein [Cellulomonas wangsupingiae]
MAFFSNDTSVPTPPALGPLTRDRVTAALDARNLGYGIDEDGDVGGYWDGHLFYFFLMGPGDKSLQVRGRWNRQVGVDQLPQVAALVNEWNSTHLWPKAYVRSEDGVVGVYGEHTVDYAHGLSDEQVDQHLACGIATALQLFDHLDEAYPAEAAAAKAEQEQEG